MDAAGTSKLGWILCCKHRCSRKRLVHTHPEEEVRLDGHAHLLDVLLQLEVESRNRRPGQSGRNGMRRRLLRGTLACLCATFSTASSIFSTMVPSSTCSSQDVLLTELTGWLFNHDVISATFSALRAQPWKRLTTSGLLFFC